MARDSSAFIRQAVVAQLNAAGPPATVWPQKAPADAPYEKLQFGQPVTVPFGASCLDGSTTTFAIHAYAETDGEGAGTVAGERRAHDLAAWAASVIGGLSVDLAADSDCPYAATAHFEWTGTQVFSDGLGTDAFHAIATFSASVVS